MIKFEEIWKRFEQLGMSMNDATDYGVVLFEVAGVVIELRDRIEILEGKLKDANNE